MRVRFPSSAPPPDQRTVARLIIGSAAVAVCAIPVHYPAGTRAPRRAVVVVLVVLVRLDAVGIDEAAQPLGDGLVAP